MVYHLVAFQCFWTTTCVSWDYTTVKQIELTELACNIYSLFETQKTRDQDLRTAVATVYRHCTTAVVASMSCDAQMFYIGYMYGHWDGSLSLALDHLCSVTVTVQMSYTSFLGHSMGSVTTQRPLTGFEANLAHR